MKRTPFHLELYFDEYEFTAPYLLCSSDCESMTIGELLALDPGASEQFQQHWLGYTEAQGSPELRALIAEMYECADAEDVLVLSGAQEGIFLFASAALNPGDHVIVQFPAYQSLYQIAIDLGCEVTFWYLTEDDENSWSADIDFLEDHIRSNTKAIIFNTPHNPTGHLMCEAQLRQIATIARKHNLLVFSDEVYRFLEHDGVAVPSMLDVYENTLALGVMSKTFGLAGLRIGWIASKNRALIKQLRDDKFYTSICNSAPSEFLAQVALKNRETLIQRNARIIRDNMALMTQFQVENPGVFIWKPPQAGPISFPRLALDRPVETFCRALVDAQGVLLLPGTVYGDDGSHFRLGLGRKNFGEGLMRLGGYLNQRMKV